MKYPEGGVAARLEIFRFIYYKFCSLRVYWHLPFHGAERNNIDDEFLMCWSLTAKSI